MESQESPVRRDQPSPAPAPSFVTLVTTGRQPWLGVPRTRDVLLAVLRSWHMERSGRVLAVQAMPDHVHVLFEPGRAGDATQIVARWKVAMRRGAGYADTFADEVRLHRLDAGEDPESYVQYMLLEPYRAGVANPGEPWAGWWLPEGSPFVFTAALAAGGLPPAEWLAWPADKFAGLKHGE